MILAGRMVSWIGKGIRGSLRDAMLSESVPAEVRGKAFGFHRAGDTVGAILGPLFGAFLLHYLPHIPADFAFRRIFLFSLIPGLLAPLAYFLMVKETRKVAKPQLSIWNALRQLPAAFQKFLFAVGLFGSGDFSPTLLIMAAATLLAPRYGAVRAAELAALERRIPLRVLCYARRSTGVVESGLRRLVLGYAVGASARSSFPINCSLVMLRAAASFRSVVTRAFGLEPAACGKPVLFGPRMEHFQDRVQVLVGRGGLQVKDPVALLRLMRDLLARPEEIRKLGELAKEAVSSVKGASARDARLIADLLP